MKKYLLVLLCALYGLDIIAENLIYTTLRDVVNSYQYNKVSLSFTDYVPLFKPSTVSRGRNHLQISSYPAETYYGKPVKATEHPKETIHAYYDSKGNLIKILRDDDDYQLEYNNNGILVGFKQYNTNTGKLINEIHQRIPISTSSNSYILAKNHGKYWYIFYPDGYIDDGGYWATFDIAFDDSNRGNDMNVLLEGKMWCNSKWLNANSTKNWKKEYNARLNQHRIFERTTPSVWVNSFPSCHYVFNGIGLLKRNGISPSDVLSQGVYKDTIYEYRWM